MAPPPVVAPAVWYLARGGQAGGPVTADQLQAWIADGRFSAESMVWTAGTPGWVPAAQAPALASLFETPPPPPAGS